MYATAREPEGAFTGCHSRRAYQACEAEREFALSVLSFEITPQVTALVEAAKERATRARSAQFLEQYRCLA